MSYTLYHPDFGFMTTEYELMRGRKIAQGWVDYVVEEKKIEEIAAAQQKPLKRKPKLSEIKTDG